MNVQAIDVGVWSTPPMYLATGTITELLLPSGWGSLESNILCHQLSLQFEKHGGVSYVNFLSCHRVNILDRILGRSPGFLLKSQGLPADFESLPDDYQTLLHRPIKTLSWSQKKNLDALASIAQKARLSLLDDNGLDPAGMANLFSVIEFALSEKQAALVMRYSTTNPAPNYSRSPFVVARRV